MHYPNEHHIFLFLIQLLLLLGLARGLGELFRRWNQPPLTAEILVGILLGPTILGRHLPDFHAWLFPIDPIQMSMLETVAWLGVLFLLLQTGLEIDFASAWRQKGEALVIALSDIFIPMLIAFIPCYFLPAQFLANPDQRFLFALFMATVLTISALPVAARVLHDLHLTKTDLGFLLMSALSVNDIIGWLIFTMILGTFIAGDPDIGRIALIVVATLAFTAVCLTIGRMATNKSIQKISDLNLPQPASSLTFICLLGLLCGAITQKIGIHALFGFFIAGIMAGGARALSERTRQVISQMVFAIFVPIFFAGIGLKVDFLVNFNVFLVALITGIGVAARFIGAWIGVTLTRLPRANRYTIAIAHTPGGAMEIVVGVLALEYGLITEPVFVAIVFGAIFSSVILGPWMRHSLARRGEISVLEFFSPRAIVPEVRAQQRNDAIRELCDAAADQHHELDAERIAQAVLQREYELGTAVERGIALPHARLEGLPKPVIVFGRSTAGIEWDSPDGLLSHFIFLILTPADDYDVQVQTLALIAKAMSGSDFGERILRAKDGAEEWDLLRDTLSPHVVKRRKE